MAIIFDEKRIKELTLVLSTRNYTHLGQIFVEDVTLKCNLNSADEISFEVKKAEHNKHIWDDITYLKLVWVKEINEYFEIEVSVSDSTDVVKSVTGKGLCESELGQTMLYNIEINTEDDIARKEYIQPTVFYRDLSQYDPESEEYKKNKESSLLHRILDKAPHYKIDYVQTSLCNIQRSFSIDGTSIYDFLTGDCAEQFDCIFKFDSTKRTISVYDLETMCITPDKDDPTKICGHRGIFNDVCPVCGGTKLQYYGDDTTVYIDKENLTEEVNFTTDVGKIKNCFRLEAGDDDMTAAVINANPNGTAYIYYVSEEQKKDMPAELVTAIEDYDVAYESKIPRYTELTKTMYNAVDNILFYTSSMMPTIEHPQATTSEKAYEELVKGLNDINNTLAITKVASYTSSATVESGIKNYARVYVKPGYFKVTVNTTEYNFVKDGLANWKGKFTITNYSDEDDIYVSPDVSMTINDDYEAFVTQKIQKYIANNDDEDGSVFQVLKIKDETKFKEALTYYALNRLTSFRDAIQGVIDVITELNNPDIYDKFYLPYYNKLSYCEDEINVRQGTIDEWNGVYDTANSERVEIQKYLNFRDWLSSRTPEGETDYYTQFCSYRREDTYTNSNFISDGLDNTTIFNNANEFIELAKKEIVKSGEAQHSISTNLYNLLCIKEFKPILDMFELGNWIRVRCEDDVYRLRLVSYEINSNDLKNINVDFSDMTKTSNGMNDITSLLSKTQSMSSSYSYVSKQASNGDDADSVIDDFRKDGLSSAQYRIMNNNDEEVIYDKNGILCREKIYPEDWDEANGPCPDYSPEQLKITHNVMCYTNDNWETVKSAIGKQTYYDENKVLKEGYGVNADFLVGGYIEGSTVVGSSLFAGEGVKDKTTGEYKYPFHVSSTDGTTEISKGSIAGWTIDDTTISSNLGNVKLDSSATGDKTVFKAGDKFSVTADGVLNAKEGNFSGTINATDGTFTGTISGSTIIGTTIQNSEKEPSFSVTSDGAITGATLVTKIKDSDESKSEINENGIKYSNKYGHAYLEFAENDACLELYNVLHGENGKGSGGRINLVAGGSSASISCESDKGERYFHYDTTGLGELKIYNESDDGLFTFENKNSSIYLTAQYIYANNTPIISSDRNIKNEIKNIDVEKSKQFIYSISPKEFAYNDDIEHRIHHGFIAQEVSEHVYDNWDLVDYSYITDTYGIKYEEIIADAVLVIQEQHKEIEELKDRISDLEREIKNGN